MDTFTKTLPSVDAAQRLEDYDKYSYEVFVFQDECPCECITAIVPPNKNKLDL